MNPLTRELIHSAATSVWLKVDPAILAQRIGRRNDRPLLQRFADPSEGISTILGERSAIYAQAQITVPIGDQPIETTVEAVLQALLNHAAATPVPEAKYLVIS